MHGMVNMKQKIAPRKRENRLSNQSCIYLDHKGEDEDEENNEIEIYTGGEYVSVMDPIALSRIQHPARCIFCTHKTCFDAKVFFEFQVISMLWKCPICLVKIRGIQVGIDVTLISWYTRANGCFCYCRISTLTTTQK